MKDFYDMDETTFFNRGESGICRFNKIVDCADKSRCYCCGWNPAVAELRSQEIRRRLNEREK